MPIKNDLSVECKHKGEPLGKLNCECRGAQVASRCHATPNALCSNIPESGKSFVYWDGQPGAKSEEEVTFCQNCELYQKADK